MAGAPDVIASPPASSRRRWVVFGLVLAAAAAAAVVVLAGAGEPDQSGQPAPSVATSTEPGLRPRATSTTIAPADRTTGSLPAPAGLPIGTAAINAARAVVDMYCDRISSWQLTIDGENGEYQRAVVVLRPAGPAYSNVVLRIELTWDTDHYDWVGSRTALAACP